MSERKKERDCVKVVEDAGFIVEKPKKKYSRKGIDSVRKFTKKNCASYTKAEIKKYARDLGVEDLEGTKEKLCKRIFKKLN
jgi:hypothetical protein